MVFLFSDASCNQTNSVGCFAILDKLSLENISFQYIITKGKDSTNMEFESIITALKLVKDKDVCVYTDCQRMVDYIYYRKKPTFLSQEEHKECLKLFDSFTDFFAALKMDGHMKKADIKIIEQSIFREINRAAKKKLKSLE